MDRDTESIGGVEKPLQPTKELFYVTVIMDVAGVLLALLISFQFSLLFFVYILFSRMYSYRGIRLKRFPVIGYLVVILNQGALIFFMVYAAITKNTQAQIPVIGLIVSSLLIGGFYPITQVYQHASDKNDGVITISMLLGKRGTFIFCGIMYAIAFGCLFIFFMNNNKLNSFLIMQLFFLPVIIYFFIWFSQVWKDESKANFKRTMRMNLIASTCTNLAFITLFILKQIG